MDQLHFFITIGVFYEVIRETLTDIKRDTRPNFLHSFVSLGLLVAALEVIEGLLGYANEIKGKYHPQGEDAPCPHHLQIVPLDYITFPPPLNPI